MEADLVTHRLLLDLHEMADLVDRAAELRGILALDGRADLAEAERAQRLARLRVGPVLGLELRDLERRHQAVTSDEEDSDSASTASAADSGVTGGSDSA